MSAAGRYNRHWSGRLLVLLMLAIGAFALSACGSSDDDDSSGGASTAKRPTGSPIVTYTFADVNTQGPQYKNIQETSRVYGEYINAQGGIDGRPLDAKFCDTKGTPTDAAACARKAVADKAVAVVGSFNLNGDAELPILKSAGVAWWGQCCSASPLELTSDISFPMGSGPLYAPGLIKRAEQDGCKKTNAVLVQGAEAFKPLMENASKFYKLPIAKYVTLPGTARDYSAQVAEATGGDADCLVMVVPETQYVAWMTAFDQSGSQARMYGPQGNLNEKVAKGHEQSTNGAVVAGTYPDLSLPQWKSYRDSLEDYDAADSEDYNSLGGLGTWAAYQGFRQVAESISGPITSASFLKAARTAKIDLPGVVPPEDFSKTWIKDGGPKGYDRTVHRCVIFSKLEGGKLKPLTKKFEDVSQAAGGKKPADCG